jgi:hypothetical protein
MNLKRQSQLLLEKIGTAEQLGLRSILEDESDASLSPEQESIQGSCSLKEIEVMHMKIFNPCVIM